MSLPIPKLSLPTSSTTTQQQQQQAILLSQSSSSPSPPPSSSSSSSSSSSPSPPPQQQQQQQATTNKNSRTGSISDRLRQFITPITGNISPRNHYHSSSGNNLHHHVIDHQEGNNNHCNNNNNNCGGGRGSVCEGHDNKRLSVADDTTITTVAATTLSTSTIEAMDTNPQPQPQPQPQQQRARRGSSKRSRSSSVIQQQQQQQQQQQEETTENQSLTMVVPSVEYHEKDEAHDEDNIEEEAEEAEEAEDEEEEETEESALRKQKEKEERELQEKKLRRQNERKLVELEILTTERDYVRNLQMCSEHFIRPIKESLQTGKPILSQDDYETMFVDLETIIPVNIEMLNSLESVAQRNREMEEGKPVEMGPKVDTLGTIFLRMTPYLRSYTAFCNKYEIIFKLIEDRKKSRKVFRKFLESKEYQPEVNYQALIAFLIRPVQRIPRYNLLLRELIKNTEEDHPDLKNLNSANTSVVNLANYVNEKLREAMNQEKCIFIENIVGGLNFELIQASRKFIKEGALGYISSRNGIQSRYVFLFSDLLLSTKSRTTILDFQTNDSTGTNVPNFNHPSEASAAANSSSSGGASASIGGGDDTSDDSSRRSHKNREKFTLRSAISFQSVPLVWLNNVPDGFIMLNAFQIVTSRKTYTFFASSAESKKEWVTAISKHLDLQHASPLLQGKERSQIHIPETSKLHVFTGAKSVSDFSNMGDTMLEGVLGTLNSDGASPSDASPAFNRLKFTKQIQRRSSGAERLEGGSSPKSPRRSRGFSTLIKTFTKRKEKTKKQTTDGEVSSTSDSEDEDEEATKDMLQWMTDYYMRLQEKQTHNRLISQLHLVTEEFKPVIADLEEQEMQIVLNPLYAIKAKNTRNYRLSVCDEMKDEINSLGSRLHGMSHHSSYNSLPPRNNQHSSSGGSHHPHQDDNDFEEFVKSYSASSAMHSFALTENNAPKEKRRRSLFASLTRK